MKGKTITSIRIGKNIKTLRTIYSESQEELMFALDLQSISAISQYEKGSRIPQIDILQKIALHYRITLDTLINSDLDQSDLPINNSIINDKEKLVKTISICFPIISSEESMKNDTFKNGFNAHTRFIGNTFKEVSSNTQEHEIDLLFKAYCTCISDEIEMPEAIANLVSIILLLEISKKYSEVSNTIALAEKRNITKLQKFIKTHILIDTAYEKDICKENEIEKYNKLIYILLKKLCKYNNYYDLAMYFLAVNYTYTLTNNSLTDGFNVIIGSELIKDLAKLDNKYAKKLIDFIDDT